MAEIAIITISTVANSHTVQKPDYNKTVIFGLNQEAQNCMFECNLCAF